MQNPGWMLVAVGLLIAGIGVIWLLAPWIPWMGRLPGSVGVTIGQAYQTAPPPRSISPGPQPRFPPSLRIREGQRAFRRRWVTSDRPKNTSTTPQMRKKQAEIGHCQCAHVLAVGNDG